ncbi:hypothetical protein PT974_08869 [Cladobotryum mycophilum]|uniref:Deoxyribonuclease NucA/NucB domain-containing protein n=1 Tax=Cladobotryum mycophilum TaxID=491253 RepID=A0ABR0SFM9_9HYPO
MFTSYKALFLALLASTITTTLASPPDITFLCDEMPEVCTNMCWAVRCAQPPFPQTLTLDLGGNTTTTTTTRYRRNNATPMRSHNITASCATNKMCGPHASNHTGHRSNSTYYRACNVYPFSSTREAVLQHGHHQVSRCVPEAEQRKQNEQLAQLSQKLQAQSHGGNNSATTIKARINFGNPGKIPFCNNDPCQNDGFEVQDGTVKRNASQAMFKYYKTRSGMTLASVDDIEMPYSFSRKVGSGEAVPSDVETWYEDGHGGRLHMMGDTIMERVSAQGSKV